MKQGSFSQRRTRLVSLHKRRKVNTDVLSNKVAKSLRKAKIMNSEKVTEILNDVTYAHSSVRDAYVPTQMNTTRFGEFNSRKNFYKKMREFNETKRKQVTPKDSTSFKFLEAASTNRCVPNPLGFIKRSGDEQTVDLNSTGMGDRYIKSLSKSLEVNVKISNLNLESCRLSQTGIHSLKRAVENNSELSRSISRINLSRNEIGNIGLRELIKIIRLPDCDLREIEVEGCNLGDASAIELCQAVKDCLPSKITILNLSANNLSHHFSAALCAVLEQAIYLKSLLIRENKLNSWGCAKIIKTLKKHHYLKILDLSWNSAGDELTGEHSSRDLASIDDNKRKLNNLHLRKFCRSMKIEFKEPLLPEKGLNSFVEELVDYFASDSITLLHLDISNNNIDSESCKELEQAVKKNHSILGIHVNNNAMEIDELGFIHSLNEDSEISKYAKSQLSYQLSCFNSANLVEEVRKLRNKNNCWICEGWREMKFSYTPTAKNYSTLVEVKLHLDFDDYYPTETTYKDYTFSAYRMCPPGKVHYFFSINNKPVNDCGKSFILLKNPLVVSYAEEGENNELVEVSLAVKRLGELRNEFNFEVINEFYEKNIEVCQPRPVKIKEEKVRLKTPWRFEMSIWATCFGYRWEGETDAFLRRCFEKDIEYMKLAKDFKTEEYLEEAKNFLFQYYFNIVSLYKNLSANDSGIWQISQSTFLEFFKEFNGLIDKQFDQNFLLLQATSIVAIDKIEKLPNLPESLVRHQFFKLLIRCLKEKYMRKGGQFPNLVECVKEKFEYHYSKTREFDHYTWRKERYFNEKVDNFLIAFQLVLEGIYCSFSSIKVPGKAEQPLNLEEFRQICERLIYPDFPIRDIALFFNYANRLKIDEIYSEQLYTITYCEFLEAFCRVVDKLSPVPPGIPLENWSLEQRKEQSLIAKLRNLVPSLFELMIHSDYKAIKEKFVVPEKDEYDLYLLDQNTHLTRPPIAKRSKFLISWANKENEGKEVN